MKTFGKNTQNNSLTESCDVINIVEQFYGKSFNWKKDLIEKMKLFSKKELTNILEAFPKTLILFLEG